MQFQMDRNVLALAAAGLEDVSSWWEKVIGSPLWQDRIFHVLAGLYAAVAAVALVVSRFIGSAGWIQMRVLEYGWTSQKIMQHVVLDITSLAFFTTYGLLVLYWAEIYYQVVIWLILWWEPIRVMVVLSKMFFAGVSLFAALGFLLFGGRLFLMLQRFPEDSKGRCKKLQEIGYVTAICFTCFLIRCIMECLNAFDKAADLDVSDHPILNFAYSLLVEIALSSLVLFILRKLPPKHGITQYHPIQ